MVSQKKAHHMIENKTVRESKYAAVVLDFDGVILESTEVKTWAFAELFKEYPEHNAEIVNYHIRNAGVSRYEKFRYIFNNILKKNLSDEEMKSLSERFSNLVMEKILKCKYVPGALDFIKRYHKKLKLFVVSATPHDEINLILEKLGIRCYFEEVFGSPKSKVELISEIMAKYNFQPHEVLFVGDQLADYMAARQLGVDFVARTHDESAFFEGLDITGIIKTMDELKRYLKKPKMW